VSAKKRGRLGDEGLEQHAPSDLQARAMAEQVIDPGEAARVSEEDRGTVPAVAVA
jgi:hypothetical protein